MHAGILQGTTDMCRITNVYNKITFSITIMWKCATIDIVTVTIYMEVCND